MPDTYRKGQHYLDVFQTALIVNGKPREPDDYQPRVNVKELVKEGSLKLQDLNSIKSFAEELIVAEELVLTALRHLYENTMAANLLTDNRRKRTGERKENKFVDYDWKRSCNSRSTIMRSRSQLHVSCRNRPFSAIQDQGKTTTHMLVKYA